MDTHKTSAEKRRNPVEPDHFDNRYNCERHELEMGNLTDDEMAGELFMYDHRRGLRSIPYLKAARDRIRWLSRQLAKSEQQYKSDKANLVPGMVRCAKCKLQLYRTNLHMQSGTTSAGNSNTEPCLNGCGPMWPITWKQWAEEGFATADRFFDEAQQLRNALRRLRAAVSTYDGHGNPGCPDRVEAYLALAEVDALLKSGGGQ